MLEGGKVNYSIEVKHLTVSYDGNEVVQDVSFSFTNGSLIGIIGPNGAGKSTLLKAMLGLIAHDRGDITIGEKRLDAWRKKIAYVPQRSVIDWDFPITVRDTVLLGTYPNLGLFKIPLKNEKQLANECLKKVGMDSFRNRQITELSGGQQQRVFLARALAQQADIFFLDEPFVGIDVASEKMIIEILQQLRDEGKTIFIVHHDLAKVEQYFDALILLNKKLIGAGPVHDVMQRDKLSEAYQINFDLLNETGAGS